MDNRLTPEEQAVIDKSKQYWKHGTPENNRHWRKACKELVRAENAKESK